MLSILLNWIYIALSCILIGLLVLRLFKKDFSLIYYLVTGFVAITVGVEFLSLFAKIGSAPPTLF